MDLNEISGKILDASIQLHSNLGPGLLESVYVSLLSDNLTQRGLLTQCQVPMPIFYQGRIFDHGFRADILVNEAVLVEVKSLERLLPVHHKQVLTYLRVSGFQLGLLINFGSRRLIDGFHRIVNGFVEGP